MSQDNYFEVDEPKKSGWRGCLMGCGIVFGVVVLLLLVGAWWMANNWRGMLGGAVAAGLEAAINESKLPEQEKAELQIQVLRVTEGFADGSISNDQLERIMKGFVESPLVTTLFVAALEEGYLKKSGLPDDEQAAAKITLQRFAWGVMQEKIGEEAIEEVLEPVSTVDAAGGRQMKESVTDEELREALALAQKHADEADIPTEFDPVDPSDELKKIIDEGLANPPIEAAPIEDDPFEDDPFEDAPADVARDAFGEQ